MASSLVITVELEKPQAALSQALHRRSTRPKEGFQDLKQVLEKITGGKQRAVVSVQTGTAAPAAGTTGGTIILASFADADTIRIGNVVLTGKSSPTTEDHFEIDGNDAADATALRDCINAHSVLSKIIVATVNSATVTVRSLIPGVISNQIYMVASAHATVTQLSGSTGGAMEAATVYHLGI